MTSERNPERGSINQNKKMKKALKCTKKYV